jgi:ADP-heptose:LPS heptosyltransferase
MNALFARALAASLRLAQRRPPRAVCDDPRILVIRRNRMGDMICTLPLLRALRRQFPAARLTVACDAAGVPIAQACSAVDEVIPLRRGWQLWEAPVRSSRQWQDFDWVIAAKAGFDRRLASLARLTNAARRIGYEDAPVSDFYTDPVPVPADLWQMHQVEATLQLLAPLGIAPPPDPVADLKLDLPASATAFADALAPSWKGRALVLINISSTSPLRFSDDDFAELAAGLSARGDLSVALVGLPADLSRAERMAERSVDRVSVLATPGPLELAALIACARVLVTGEGGAAHLAAATGTPAVVLWSEAPFEKWHSRGANHVFVRTEPGEETIPLARVRDALAAHL